MSNFAHSCKGIALPVHLKWNYCGGLTGKKYERTKSRHKTIIRGWRAPRPQNFEVESKNEEIYFW